VTTIFTGTELLEGTLTERELIGEIPLLSVTMDYLYNERK
jgi:hypothetical protein